MAGVWKRRSGGAWVTEGYGTAAAAGSTVSHFELFGPEPRGAEALTGTSTGGYVWPGDALSSSVQVFRFDLGLSGIVAATWRLIWTPNDAANGMRLIHADSGPANITQIAEFTGSASTTPLHQSVDVTADLAALVTGGAWKQVGHQINAGATGPKIHASRLEIVWAS